MKALTLWQPWATLVAMGQKSVETRCWTTKYRGELAIHAAAKLPPKWLGASSRTDPFRDELADVFAVRRDSDDRCGKHVDDILRGLPYGKIVCVVRLADIDEIDELVRYTVGDREQVFGNYEDGRYAWWLELVDVFEPPIPAKGNRMLWNWEHAHTSKPELLGSGPIPSTHVSENESRDPDRLNSGNPNYTPYQVEENKS